LPANCNSAAAILNHQRTPKRCPVDDRNYVTNMQSYLVEIPSDTPTA